MDHNATTDLAGLRLLLVEDEYLIAQFLAEIVQEMGAEVLGPVASVDDALELIADCPDTDAAILDVNLRGEVVYPVADVLIDRRVPLVFTSGYGRDALPTRYGDIDLFTKPVCPSVVTAALAGLRRDAARLH